MIRREGGEVEREYGNGVGEIGDEDDVGARGEGRRTLQGLPQALCLRLKTWTSPRARAFSRRIWRATWKCWKSYIMK